jgi:hypothetical protein
MRSISTDAHLMPTSDEPAGANSSPHLPGSLTELLLGSRERASCSRRQRLSSQIRGIRRIVCLEHLEPVLSDAWLQATSPAFRMDMGTCSVTEKGGCMEMQSRSSSVDASHCMWVALKDVKLTTLDWSLEPVDGAAPCPDYGTPLSAHECLFSLVVNGKVRTSCGSCEVVLLSQEASRECRQPSGFSPIGRERCSPLAYIPQHASLLLEVSQRLATPLPADRLTACPHPTTRTSWEAVRNLIAGLRTRASALESVRPAAAICAF